MSDRAAAGPALRVGVDVGGSKIAVLVVDRAGTVRGRVSRPTAVGAPDGAADAIVATVDEALGQSAASRRDVAAVGVGVPGRVEPDTGEVALAVNLGWNRLPLGRQLAERIGAPVAVENDVRAAASGLHARRVLGDVENLAYLGIGTGISAGVVLGGRLHRGARGLAGEIGHSVLDPDGPPCACGLRGCFEALAAGPAIARRAAALLRDGHAVTAPAPGHDRRNGTLTAADVYAAAAAGDAAGLQIADEVGRYVARAVHELLMAYDVEVVVLGGGVARAGDAFLDPILRALDRLRAQSDLAREVLTPGVVRLLPPSAEVGTWGAVTLAAEAERRAAGQGTDGRRPAAASTAGRTEPA